MSNALNSVHPSSAAPSAAVPNAVAPGAAAPIPSLPHLDVIDLRSSFQVEAFEHGEVIYRPGDPANRVYILRSGRVRLLRKPPQEGTSVAEPGSLIALLRSGDLFGDLLRPSDALMEEVAVAVGDTEVWTLNGSDLAPLLEARPTLAIELLQALNDRARQLRKRVNALTFKEVPARLAEAILQLADTHGEYCPHGAELDLRGVTQQDLADLVGASRSFVSTLVNEMKRDGMLANVGRTLCIRNRELLGKLAVRDRV